MISVIIPTLNAGNTLANTLASLESLRGHIEVLVIDTGEAKDTQHYSTQYDWVHWLCAEPGRGPQLIAGVEAASGDILLFLHGDTVLVDGWVDAVLHAVNQPGFVLGAFTFKLDHPGWKFRVVERGVAWRCRRYNLPYGDQALFTTSEMYQELGGFPPIPLMEDVELVWKARTRGKVTLLPLEASTSAEKWLNDGVWNRTLKNWKFYRSYKKKRSDAFELAREYYTAQD